MIQLDLIIIISFPLSSCRNNCGEIVPDLDEATRSATEEEKQLAIDNFAVGLLDGFQAYFCNNFLVIAYWENETMVCFLFVLGHMLLNLRTIPVYSTTSFICMYACIY